MTKNKFSFLISLVVILNQSIAFAQNSFYSLHGKAIDKNKKAIESGNVIALNPKDLSIIKGDFFIEGLYKLDHLTDSFILLKIMAPGFNPSFKIVLHLNEDSLNIEDIQLMQGKNLGEVEIVARIPLFENDGEKIKVNVEGTNLGAGGTVIDVLRRSPGIIVTGGENVSIFGKGAPIIYIDGQLIASNDILKALPAADVKSIEIIRNPSARYDAAGRAVINIITKKANLEGYNGSLIQNLNYAKYFVSYTGLRFNAKKGNWSSGISYGNSLGKDWDSDLYERTFKTNDTTQIHMNNFIYNTNENKNTHYYRINAEYAIDSLSTISSAYNGFYNQLEELSDNANTISQNSVELSILKTKTVNVPVRLNHNANLNYFRKLDTLGSEFFIGTQFGNFVSGTTARITQDVIQGNTILKQEKRNRNTSDIKIYAAQTDLTKYFDKKWKLDVGLKESYVTKGGEVNFENFSNNDWVQDPAYYSGFDFNENIAAAYSELRFKNKKFNARIGARVENTATEGFSKNLDSQVVKRNYTNFFPSAFIGYDFTKEINLGITYSSRINRPTYNDMNPFINYIDSLSTFRGNPYLLPEFTTSLEGSLTYDKQVTLLTFGYNRTNGAMNMVIDKLEDGSNAFTATTKNLDYSESYSIGTTLPYENKWTTFATYFGYFWNTFTYKQSGVAVTNSKPMYYIYLYNEYRIKKSLAIEIEGEYTGSGVDGIFTFNPFYYLNIAVKKKFLNDKLSVRLIASDILSSYKEWGGSNVPGYDVKYLSRENTHSYGIMINYNFGKMKQQQLKNKTVNQEEYNRIKMDK